MGKGELEPSLSCVEREVRVVVLARVLCGSGEENGLVVVRMGRWWGNADRDLGRRPLVGDSRCVR